MSTTGSNAFYYLPDSLNSTANLVNASGVTQSTYTYEPYGALRSSSNAQGAPTNLMRFNGQLIDTVDNLYHLRARMYDPTTGRLLSRDPLPEAVGLPFTSTYAYSMDRPTVMTDPTGEAGEHGLASWAATWVEGWAVIREGLDEVSWGSLIKNAAQCVTQGIQFAVTAQPAIARYALGTPGIVESFIVGCAVGIRTPPTGPAPVG